MYESPEPLTTFFSRLIPAALAARYKLVVTLLAREADSEEVFHDLERYWSSIHDVTGEHILFVLGAHRAASKFPHTGMRERRQPVIHVNTHAAIAGRGPIYWPRDSFYLHDQPHCGHDMPTEGLARSHSLEIAGLRDMFSLQEDSIPALLFFTLEPGQLSLKPIVLPLSALGQQTIYGFLKKLIGELEVQFLSIQARRSELADLTRRLDNITRKERKCPGWSVRLDTADVRPEVKEAVNQILEICDSSTEKPNGKRKCFDLLQIVTKEVGSHARLTAELQRLIDRAFFRGSHQESAYLSRKEALLCGIDKIRMEEEETWHFFKEQLQRVLNERRLISNPSTIGWDYFIAYSSKDAWYADRIYTALSKSSSVFLDRFCLKPGDVWPARLRAEQDRSHCTLVLLTGNTDHAWFTHSEYLHAIDLVRSGSHRVVPILIGDRAKIPYGLEQIHALRHTGNGDFTYIAKQLAVGI